MTQPEIAQILAAIARLETKVDGLQRDDDRAAEAVKGLERQVNWLQRVAWTGLGLGSASILSVLSPLMNK